MSNTVITNYTDLNGPSSKTDSSVVVIVNKDGSLSVDQKLLGTLMGSDGSQTAGISVVRVGHEGRPDDATDSEDEDDKVPHVTLSVDSYYDEPNSIIKYDSGAEMLQSLRIETRENSLVGFHNDHCYTPLKSPSESISQITETFKGFDDPVIEITHTPPPKPQGNSKKITILEQQIIPKGKKIIINPSDAAYILKGNDVLNKPLPVLTKSKHVSEAEKKSEIDSKAEEHTESSSVCSSGDSTADRDSDSDYKDAKNKPTAIKLRKTRTKPRILKTVQPSKNLKVEPKIISRLKPVKNVIRREGKERVLNKIVTLARTQPEPEPTMPKENQLTTPDVPTIGTPVIEQSKIVAKPLQKVIKKEKKTPAHMSALLSDMTSLFSTPDVIRRVSTDNKTPSKSEREISNTKVASTPISNKDTETNEEKSLEEKLENMEKTKSKTTPKILSKQKERSISIDKSAKGYDTIPQLDDASLAQILQDTTPQSIKSQPSISAASVINSPGLAGPLSPTLDLLGGLQPEEDGLTEDLLMHVAQLVESSENLQEVIDKQVLGKVDTMPAKTQITSSFPQQQLQPMQMQQVQQVATTPVNVYSQNATKSGKSVVVRKDPIEIVRRDGRVITLPPIEAPATRASKRKSQVETSVVKDVAISTPATTHLVSTPEQPMLPVSKQYSNKKLANKKQEQMQQPEVPVIEKISAESQESWNSEDDPNRLWCICKQPHNNRFMICCDGCEDWFHGKCVNITKAMGQQMEEQGIEWRCPNCKNAKAKNLNKSLAEPNTSETVAQPAAAKETASRTTCIVCKKSARASSIYCSDACILKHAQDSLGAQVASRVDTSGGKTAEKGRSESRVIVYERKSGRLLAGPNAPTADNLKAWLQKNPTFEVVRPGTLSTIKPNLVKKKSSVEPNKIQTTLNFARIPRKSNDSITPVAKTISETKEKTVKPPPVARSLSETKEKAAKPMLSPKEAPARRGDERATPAAKTPVTPKMMKLVETPKASTSKTAVSVSETPKKPARPVNRSQSASDRAPSASPSTSRRKDTHEPKKMNSVEPIRDNVRKSLQEQMSARMAESDGPKFTEEEIQQFANDTENELHELFGKDVGMKYKAKYRSLMFNIKDRKNLTLWEKICDRTITPKQLVRLSPEELASQELAQWRDKEVKHQLELIKKSELDLLAANKTYVLKTHKGEEVMENKESVSTELDPNVPVEDVVTALNDATEEELTNNVEPMANKKAEKTNKKLSSKKKEKESSSRHSRRESRRDREKRKSSRRRTEMKEKDDRSKRKSRKRSTRDRSESKDRSKKDSKEKSVSRERSRHRSRSREESRVKSKRYSKDHSRSNSRARDRSRSGSKRRSRSKDSAKRSRRSRSKQRSSTEEKNKHRSRSQDTVSTKIKNDSTDSDSVERPKSATLKEVHPEYDPHEPMITSAFSEEDLRKSREDVYEESYKNDIADFGDSPYDPSKSFSIDTNVIMPTSPYPEKQDKVSEPESDQEPTSTVENSAATVWNGCINMVDVARFYVAAHEVSGNAVDLEEDLSTELDIVGRINPETVWDYIKNMKRASNKDIVILRLQAANDEEMMQYIALYSYLSTRNRLGVVKVTNTATVKDFYIVPLPANTSLPAVLLPLDGPGLGDVKTHLLVAIIIRQRKKRRALVPKDIVPAKVARTSRKRSYTPPLAGRTPPASPRRRALPLPAAYTTPALSSSVKDKIAATLASADDEEAYSPGSSTSSGGSAGPAPPADALRNKMEELNRQIEEQKQQILKMAQADSSIGEDEAYSPSKPMTPSPPQIVPLDHIALPSNLQEILATIKQRTENPVGDVDMRQLT